jgi:hypothetical protein
MLLQRILLSKLGIIFYIMFQNLSYCREMYLREMQEVNGDERCQNYMTLLHGLLSMPSRRLRGAL